VPLRIAFDLDGVLADMDVELLRRARELFGEQAIHRVYEMPGPAPSDAVETVADTPRARANTPAERPKPVAPPLDATPDDAPPTSVHLTQRQQSRLWRHVESIDSFWESLQEIEPGAVARLNEVAKARRWEIIFLTKRPESAGPTAQLQTQRWLQSKGFALPSVFVVQGSRGRIAAALGLDFVIDDRPENCLDVVVDSKARAILVWRDDEKLLPAAAKRLGIGAVRSVAECLDILTQIDTPPQERPNMFDRVMRLLGLKETAHA
jgi:hypothetical protein